VSETKRDQVIGLELVVIHDCNTIRQNVDPRPGDH